MAKSIEIKVPDIGDFDAVPVIELLVAVGDTVKLDQGLLTLESDKATSSSITGTASKSPMSGTLISMDLAMMSSLQSQWVAAGTTVFWS